MHPILLRFELGGATFRLGAYSCLIFCGAVAGLLILLRRSREANLSPRDLLPVLTWAVVVGFLGARLTFVLQYGIVPYRGGFVLYGGLIAGTLTAIAAARAKGLPALRIADLAVPCALLAAAFGRLGCVLAGCCYGTVTGAGLSYPPGSHAFRDQVRRGLISADAAFSLPTVPTALLEAVALVLLFLGTSLFWRRRPRSGAVLAAGMLSYALWRFVAEFWRGDHAAYWMGALTFSQGISLACIAAAGAFWAWRVRSVDPVPVVALSFRPASAVQVLGLLAAVGCSLGGISCASRGDREGQSTHVIRAYHKSNVDKPQGSEKHTGEHGKSKDSDDFFSDCMVDCMAICAEECADAICEAACSKNGEDGTADSPKTPWNAVLGRLTPGKKYRGDLEMEAVVNKRLDVVLKMAGTISTKKPAADGSRLATLNLRKMELQVGENRWTGSGEVELQVGPELSVVVLRGTLPGDLMDALASLQELSGKLLRCPPAEHPIVGLQNDIREELSRNPVQAGFSIRTTFEGTELWTLGQGKLVQDPPGTFTLEWRVGH